MDTKQLLLEKFIYVVNNSEIIIDYIESSMNHFYDRPFSYPQLESLLFSYKYLFNDINYCKVELYKKHSDTISSYDLISRIHVTGILLNQLDGYIKKQKKDITTKEKKIKIMKKYFQLLAYISHEETSINSYIKLDDDINHSRFVIRPFNKSQSLSFSKYTLLSMNKPYYHQMEISKEKKDKDTWIKDNLFIRNNVDIVITEKEEQNVLEAVRKDKNYIKRMGIIKK